MVSRSMDYDWTILAVPSVPPVVTELPLSRISTPFINFLRFRSGSITTLPNSTLHRVYSGGGDRRSIAEAEFNDRAFKDDPTHEGAVFLGSKLGYVIVGTSVDHVPIKASNGSFMYTLSYIDEEHCKINQTIHVTTVVTKGLNYNERAPDGSYQLRLDDPRILAYATEVRTINWVPCATR